MLKLFSWIPWPKHKLMTHTVIWFLLIALIPLGIVTYLTFWYARQTVNETMLQHLYALAQRQSHQLKMFFSGMEHSVGLLATNPNVIDVFTLDGKHQFQEEAKKHFDPVFEDMLTDKEFASLLLVNPRGQVIYSVGALGSVDVNLNDSYYRDTALGRSFENTLMAMGQQVSDYELFLDSSMPALFFSSPVFYNKRLQGVVIIQVKNKIIHKMVNNYTGLGETGETIVARQDGDDIVILNPTRHDPKIAFSQGFSIKNPKLGALTGVLTGQHGSGVSFDYRGKKILAAWEYIPELRWGLMVKKDLNEAQIPVLHLRQLAFSVGASTFIVVFVVAVFAAQTIIQPITRLTGVAERIARGDLNTESIKKTPRNEIGVLSRAIVLMASNLKLLINEVKESSDQVVSINEDITQASQKQSSAVTQTVAVSSQIQKSSQEISSTARSLSSMMQEVNKTVKETAEQAKLGLVSLTAMEANMKELVDEKQLLSQQLSLIKEKAAVVNTIITTMTKVSDQTNLLSLNAAIQAKQAGEAGSGFGVVAQKMRDLADQANESTLEIERMIRDMEQAVGKGVRSMDEFSSRMSANLETVTSLSHSLARVIVEVQALPNWFERVFSEMKYQAESAAQVQFAIGQMRDNVQQTSSILMESQKALSRLNASSNMLKKEIARFRT